MRTFHEKSVPTKQLALQGLEIGKSRKIILKNDGEVLFHGKRYRIISGNVTG